MCPATKVSNQADSANAMNGLKFEDIPLGGALATLCAAGVTVLDTISFSVGTKEYLVDAHVNIEISADVVQFDRDKILDREVIIPGKIFIPVSVTTALNWLLILEYGAAEA